MNVKTVRKVKAREEFSKIISKTTEYKREMCRDLDSSMLGRKELSRKS